MDGFFSLVVAVNNQVKDVAGFGFHGDKLLAALGGAADVVNQRQVPVRGQGSATAGLAASEQPQQGGKFFFIKGEGEAALAGSFCLGVADGQIILNKQYRIRCFERGDVDARTKFYTAGSADVSKCFQKRRKHNNQKSIHAQVD